ncbi:MAG: NAD-dependent epimerase/dehydratase family protein [Oscillospiraceae bacterium]|nr:NAD-dependent epimerase/dehydratase family protein [Oscillospiraceae bacterium]MBQ9959194.1 NAD-dependent epimerase/dehydratase family protein [Oscillospiraceae bacterium]
MKVLITGVNGFVGRNLAADLARYPERYEVLGYDIDNTPEQLAAFCRECDFVVHLAGINRPKDESEFQTGNAGLTEQLCELLAENPVPVAMTSSIQAALDNPYGVSKHAAEQALFSYAERHGVPVYIWRMPNLFGKWCRPNYNSAVATFCHNIARDLPITVSDPARVMTLVYIDDVVRMIKEAMDGHVLPGDDGYCEPDVEYIATLGEIVELIRSFRESRNGLKLPELVGLAKPLYSTYLSYLPHDEFAYSLKLNSDARGLFAEFFKTDGLGQFSISTTVPGVTRGNHWHHTKVEKFLVVSGEADLNFRRIGTDSVITYHVTGDNPQVVDIPVGYTHNIVNTSDTEILVTVIWANELFDPNNPDTYYEEV